MFGTKGSLKVAARPARFFLGALAVSVAGVALAASSTGAGLNQKVSALLIERLPKTPLTEVNCEKVAGLCEITSGSNLFYVDSSARYLVIGRVYDMQTRQDITAARLLEINPDMLLGGAAKANAAGSGEETAEFAAPAANMAAAGNSAVAAAPLKKMLLASLPKDGTIVWGNPKGETVTVFSDFRCGYCRALSAALQSLNVRVVERPISALGSRDLSNAVYCSKNKEQALHAAYAGNPIPPAPSCNTAGLDANEKFARDNGISGTPVIVRSDGAVLEGYRPKEFLRDWLKGSQS